MCSVNGVQSVSTGFEEGGVGGIIPVYKRPVTSCSVTECSLLVQDSRRVGWGELYQCTRDLSLRVLLTECSLLILLLG